jgi:hypothetical protein
VGENTKYFLKCNRITWWFLPRKTKHWYVFNSRTTYHSVKNQMCSSLKGENYTKLQTSFEKDVPMCIQLRLHKQGAFNILFSEAAWIMFYEAVFCFAAQIKWNHTEYFAATASFEYRNVDVRAAEMLLNRINIWRVWMKPSLAADMNTLQLTVTSFTVTQCQLVLTRNIIISIFK